MGNTRNRTFNDSNFWETSADNIESYIHYFNRLMELSISMFDWQNLPDTVDARFMEMTLFRDGMALFFYDDVLGYLTLKTTAGGPLDVYGIPIYRHAYSYTGWYGDFGSNDSVLIYNNMIHTNATGIVLNFAKRLWELDRIIDINAKAQKTPILVTCPEEQRLSFKNLYKHYSGNEPVIFGDKSVTYDSLKVLQTGAPYVADKLYTLKTQIWNEALTFLGISNLNIQKRERLITDEVTRNQGGTIASRFSRLEARRQACDKINKMFGLNIWCDFKDDYKFTEDFQTAMDESAGIDLMRGENRDE